MKQWIPAFLVAALIGAVAGAQSRETVDQGTPGTEGCWPVCMSGNVNIYFDAGYIGTTAPYNCTILSPHKVTSVTNAATAVPASPSIVRKWINVCNSPQNAAGSIIKCRADGTSAVFALGNAGDVLELGDCAQYTTTTAQDAISCISNAAGGVSTLTYECL